MEDGLIKDYVNDQNLSHVLEIEFDDCICVIDEETLKHYDISKEEMDELMHDEQTDKVKLSVDSTVNKLKTAFSCMFKHSDIEEETFDEFLNHSGILGMKWGVRRYQNPDGTLTEEGRQRYGVKAAGNTKIVADALIKKEQQLETGIVDGVKSAFYQAADVIPNIRGKNINKNLTTYKTTKYSNLDEKELSTRINRMRLERSYGDLTGETKYVKSGQEKVREILQTTGAMLALVGTGLAIAQKVSNVKEGRLGG